MLFSLNFTLDSQEMAISDFRNSKAPSEEMWVFELGFCRLSSSGSPLGFRLINFRKKTFASISCVRVNLDVQHFSCFEEKCLLLPLHGKVLKKAQMYSIYARAPINIYDFVCVKRSVTLHKQIFTNFQKWEYNSTNKLTIIYSGDLL